MQEKTTKLLIVAGAITAAGLPFAIAFPRSLLEKMLAVAALVLAALGVAFLVRKK